VSFLATTISQDFSAMSTTPPPSFDIDASSGLNVVDTLALASTNEHSPYYPSDSEVASAALPGECSNSLSHELSTNFLREKSNSGDYQNSPFGGAESNQSFEEEEHELHDFLEKVLHVVTWPSCAHPTPHSLSGRITFDARNVQIDGSRWRGKNTMGAGSLSNGENGSQVDGRSVCKISRSL
jgi:hypothetical protein